MDPQHDGYRDPIDNSHIVHHYQPANGGTYLRWIVGGVVTVCLGMASILWNQSQSQMAELRTQVVANNTIIGELKSDEKMLIQRQQEISDKLNEMSGYLKPGARRAP